MNVLFFGTSEFAVPVLEGLLGTGHPVALVVTAPDRPAGRGRRVEAPPIAALARARDLPLFQPEKINAPDALERLRAALGGEPALAVVVAYGQILGRTLLGMFPDRIVNLHGSLLPQLRGAAPIARAIQQGATRTGVSLQHVVREVDAGDVIATAALDIEPGETAGALSARMARLAATLLLGQLDALARGAAPRTAQDAARATHAPPLEKSEGRIPWHKTAAEIVNHVRAMSPWPGAFTEVEIAGVPERIAVRAIAAAEGPHSGAEPGTVVRADDALEIASGDRPLRILRLVRAGKNETDAAAFLRGNALAVGARCS